MMTLESTGEFLSSLNATHKKSADQRLAKKEDIIKALERAITIASATWVVCAGL